VTVIGGPDGGDVRVAAPPLEGKPEHVKEFVGRLSPHTVYRRKADILRWIQSTLETEDLVTPAQVQDALEELWGTSVRDDDVLEAFSQLEATGRYKKVSSDLLPLGLRRATWSERNRHLLRRRWRWLVGWGVSGGSALVAIVSCLVQHPQMARGGLAVAVTVPVLNHLGSRLLAFLKQR
jgi:hypothetical protein